MSLTFPTLNEGTLQAFVRADRDHNETQEKICDLRLQSAQNSRDYGLPQVRQLMSLLDTALDIREPKQRSHAESDCIGCVGQS